MRDLNVCSLLEYMYYSERIDYTCMASAGNSTLSTLTWDWFILFTPNLLAMHRRRLCSRTWAFKLPFVGISNTSVVIESRDQPGEGDSHTYESDLSRSGASHPPSPRIWARSALCWSDPTKQSVVSPFLHRDRLVLAMESIIWCACNRTPLANLTLHPHSFSTPNQVMWM